MTDSESLVLKFNSFFYEVLPLFAIKEIDQAREDLSEPKNIHTILHFLRSPDLKALIINVKTIDDTKKKFLFHLNPREVGTIHSGFTLIKRDDFALEKKFKYVFHALNIEAFLVYKLDVVLFEELLNTLHPANKEKSKDQDGSNPIFTFGSEEKILSKVESQRDYIKIQEPSERADLDPVQYFESLQSSSGGRQKSKKIEYAPSERQLGTPGGGSHNSQKSSKIIEKIDTTPKTSNYDKKVSTPQLEDSTLSHQSKSGPRPQTKSPTPIKKGTTTPTPEKVRVSGAKTPKSGRKIDLSNNKSRNSSRSPSSRNINIFESDTEFKGKYASNKQHIPTSDQKTKKKKKQIFVLESLDAARDGLNGSKAHVCEISTYHVPPKGIEMVFQAVVYLLTGRKQGWAKIKPDMKRPGFVKDIVDLSIEEVEKEVIDDVIKTYLMHDDWDINDISKESPKSRPFGEWVETFVWEWNRTYQGAQEE